MLRTVLPKLSRIQAPVRDGLDQVLDELRRIVLSDFRPVEEVNDYLLLARGKLFRPTLLLLSNRIGERPDERAATIAAVVELTHLATLVHDDSVDHSVLRRGMPTVNALWNHQTAVIMGDYLYSRSISELARFGRVELIDVLAKAANEMSVGELRQLTSCDALEFGEQDYFRLIASKTASLMSAACEMGAMIGDERWREPLSRYGYQLGLAFQIADDLIDYTIAEEVTGKPSGQDLREHKMTLPLINTLERLSGVERTLVTDFFADPDPRDDAIAEIVALVDSRGGLDYARDRAQEFAERAAAELVGLPDGDATEALRDAVAYVVGRNR
ncbi:MAG TPA: polyprenyl synthetase family protein [Longimicrobiales bacterium]|nr:polyprenyl synthetase family protein [Longimicrobiales bacterium]